MEPSLSKNSILDEHKRPKIIYGFGTPIVPSTSKTMAATSSVVPSTPTQSEIKTKMHISPLSPSTSAEMGPSTSNTIRPSTPSMKPSTPIPEIYDWTHSRIINGESQDFLKWAVSTGKTMADPDEFKRLLRWASLKVNIADISRLPKVGGKSSVWSPPISKIADPNEPRRKVVKWAHSTSTVGAPDECKRWSLQEEISKPFETALKRLQEEITQNESVTRRGHLKYQDGCTDLKQKHTLYTCQKGMHGVYECQNALWIWPRLRNSQSMTPTGIYGGPREVGKKIKEKFPESDMIEGRPSINDHGFVTIELSGKWIAKSIHKMLEAGMDTWAPKLTVERVIIDYPSLEEEKHVDMCRRCVIGYTLMSILKYSKVDVTIGHPATPSTRSKKHRAHTVLHRWFSTEARPDTTRSDFDIAYKDLLALWYGLQRSDWMVYLTPVEKQEFIEMCFSTAKLEERAGTNRHKPARTSYAGYRNCSIELELKLLKRAKTRVAVEQAEDAKLLGYTPDAVLDCVLKYTYLKTHRLAELIINDEIFKVEGNTFLYLLNTQAKIRRITDDSREDINELKKASELILGKVEGWEKGEERMLGCRLLEFTEAVEESCLSVLPHILCEYLYDLSNKFNRYYSCVCKAGSVTDTSTLLLCEATALVMEKCFHLLGICPASSFFMDQTLPRASQLSVSPLLLRLELSAWERRMDVNARDSRRKSRFELFSFLTRTAMHLGSDKVGKVFGVISVSDKYGLVRDEESHFFEPDFAHALLFNHTWCDPIIPDTSGLVYLGIPNSGRSVMFSSSIEVCMELYVAKDEDACYQVCNHKIELDLSDFCDKKLESACGALTISGEEGATHLFYILLKDAIDASLEVSFQTEAPGRKLRGYVLGYYGDDFLVECGCPPSDKYHYMSVLFLPNHDLGVGAIQLIKSLLAVPAKGSLVITAYLEDVESGEVIMKNSCKFKSQPWGSSSDTISGTDCQFDLKVDWKY